MHQPTIVSVRGLFALIAVSLLTAVAPAYAENDTPMAVITGAVDDIKAGLGDRRGDFEEDEAALLTFVDGLLSPRFDRNYAGRLVLGQHWKKADTEQKKRFIAGFYSAMLGRYAAGILEFQEDRVEILPARGKGDDKKKRAIVRTIVTLDNNEQVPVNYGLVQRGESGWKVYDVNIEGISYIRNFRAEIDSEIKKTSLDAVIERLEKEAAGS
ncbi:MAG: ABC transporter substrate-binding protein [Pseudomonadota bacterium]